MYDQLDSDETAIWSLLLAGGYLKVVEYETYEEYTYDGREPEYELALTNLEVRVMFQGLIRGWFCENTADYNDFIKALLRGDIDAMNEYMNGITQSVFSYFDMAKNSEKSDPERFYHGFVLGLLVELRGRYMLTSNRESGFGRYDVMLEPVDPKGDAIIIEFKVFRPKKEGGLADTVDAALRQIEDKRYEASLTAKGIPKERIRKYGFAFHGKEVLIGTTGVCYC